MDNNRNNILEGRKVFAIEDKNGSVNIEFINSVEKEHNQVKLTYYILLARICVFFASFSAIYMVLASLSLFRLAGLISIEPYLMIKFDKSENIVRSEPIATNMASKHQLMETFVRQYILTRNTIIDDALEMRSRWMPGGMVNFLSSPQVFADFAKQEISQMKAYQDKHLTREVEIISVSRQGGDKSPIWKVDFKTNDLYSETGQNTGVQIFKERFWTASVTSFFIPERSFVGRRLINPLGFTVTRYSQSAIDLL